MSTLVSGRYAPAPTAGSAGWIDLKSFFTGLARHYQETRARVENHYRRLAAAKQLSREMQFLETE